LRERVGDVIGAQAKNAFDGANEVDGVVLGVDHHAALFDVWSHDVGGTAVSIYMVATILRIVFNRDFVGAMTEKLAAESITRVLYPDDSTTMGQELRFLQEYFLSACSVQDVVRRFRDVHTDWYLLPDKAAIQLNATHPTL
jgi:glucan phosphorylase